jgi:hypothetical protein
MKSVCTVSNEAYTLFNDQEWIGLLKRNGVDLTRSICYYESIFGISVFYDDTFIGEGI